MLFGGGAAMTGNNIPEDQEDKGTMFYDFNEMLKIYVHKTVIASMEGDEEKLEESWQLETHLSRMGKRLDENASKTKVTKHTLKTFK